MKPKSSSFVPCIRVAIAFLFFLISNLGWAQPLVNVVAASGASGWKTGAGANTITFSPAFSFTPGTNGMLIVTVSGELTPTNPTVTYDGMAMTQAVGSNLTGSGNNGSYSSVWYLANPTVGNGALIVTTGGAVSRYNVYAIYATGAEQSAPAPGAGASVVSQLVFETGFITPTAGSLAITALGGSVSGSGNTYSSSIQTSAGALAGQTALPQPSTDNSISAATYRVVTDSTPIKGRGTQTNTGANQPESVVIASFAPSISIPPPPPAVSDTVFWPSETNPKLGVYRSVPSYTSGDTTVDGLPASDQYSFRIRYINGDGTTSDWFTPFASKTYSSAGIVGDPYFPTDSSLYSMLSGWSNTYINFEMKEEPNAVVEVEITKLNGSGGTVPITKALGRPLRKVGSTVLANNKAYIRISKPCQVAIDINGQMEDQTTGIYPGIGRFTGKVDTLTLFANPFIENKPKMSDANVRVAYPGQTPPVINAGETLYFAPGVHTVGKSFLMATGRSYYIPGDAIVYGTFSTQGISAGDIRVFGYGTISGKLIPHPGVDGLAEKDVLRGNYISLGVTNATNCKVEGITFADSAYYTIMLVNGSYVAARPNIIRWAKIFTWRANGDGINPFNNTQVEDCFIRTQDDCIYARGRGIKRVVLWNDSNGSSFLLMHMPNDVTRPLIIEDCDVIYSRNTLRNSASGRIFSGVDATFGTRGRGVIFRNINIEDPFPTNQAFFLYARNLPVPVNTDPDLVPTADFTGTHFQNITVASRSTLGFPDLMLGENKGRVTGLTFDNVTIAGTPISNQGLFFGNEHVGNNNFINAQTPSEVSLWGRWLPGTTRPKESGSDRALVVMVHAESSSAVSAPTVTYGGRAMTRVVDRSHSSGPISYTGAFILNEAGVTAADAAGVIDVTWTTAPSGGTAVQSAFFNNVNQSVPIGASSTGGSTGSTVSTQATLSNSPGDMVILGTTAANNFSYTMNSGFRRGLHETSTGFGDYASAHKLATGANETPSVMLSSSTGQSIIGFVLRKNGMTFGQWATSHGLSGSNTQASADPDFDGVANLIEYAVGLAPNLADTNPIQSDQIVVAGKAYLRLRVVRNPDVAAMVNIEGLSTGTLSAPNSWSTITTVEETNTESLYEVRDTVPMESASSRFMRLRLTEP